nr:hypothetical protein [Nonomuraea turkmeniaca]
MPVEALTPCSTPSARNSRNGGIGMPSEIRSVAPMDGVPPMSGECAAVPAKPTSTPPWKIGVIMAMSGRCPVAIHGSSVVTQSPSCRSRAGNLSRTTALRELIRAAKPGMPARDSAMVRPWRSIRTTV